MKFNRNLGFRQEWFLLLSPAFIVVRGFGRFPEAISWTEIFWLFLEYSAWSVFIAFCLSWFLPFRKAAFFAFVFMLFNSLYSSLYQYLVTTDHPPFYTRFRFIFPLVCVVFVLLFLFLKKTKFSLNRTTRFLNFLFMLLIAIEAAQFGLRLSKQRKKEINFSICEKCPRPDVYLIITDGYAGTKQLKDQFRFDNTAFADSIRGLGFYVADSSFSNYGATGASMASLLNMEYVTVGTDDDIHARMNRSNVVRFFEKMNYKLVNHSIFKMGDEVPANASMYFKTGTVLITQYSFFSHLQFVFHNFLSGAGASWEKKRMAEMHLQRTQKERSRDSATMNNLLATVRTKETTPRFVYTHFMMPHPPYLFNKNGQQLDISATAQERYVEYLQYTNGKLLGAVKRILRESAQPPVILLLSDHGFRNDDEPVPNPLRFYNLAAVYLPDKNYKPYYKGISNVNQFRILLNGQFGQRLELLRDSIVN